jgi:type IV secretion system protein TrbJ
MRKRILIPIFLAYIPTSLLAQIFGPTIVFDPTVAGHVVTEIARIVQLYKTATDTYNQIAYNAAWFLNKRRWLGMATQVVNSNTRSLFGETGGWNAALTAGMDIPGAWNTATYGIHPPPFWSGFPLGASSTSANIASVNVADGMTEAAMLAIANSRTNQPANDLALSNLEATSQDTSDGANSEVQQLNLLTSGTVLANRQQEDANALLTTIAEQQILSNKVQRDLLADNLNVMTTADNYTASEPTQWGSSAATIAEYRQ